MTDRIIEDLPGGWRGVIHDLAVTLKLAEPTPGEREAMRDVEAHEPAGTSAPPEAIENGAEPDDALNPHAESEIIEPPGWQDPLDMAYGAAEAREALFAACRADPEAGQ